MSIKAVDLVNSPLSGDEILPYMVEVSLPTAIQDERDAFLKIRETLTRIGIASRRDVNTLYQTCHILSKRGKFYICHFKSMFVLDGRENNLSVSDIARQNRIARLLQEWGLLTILDPSICDEPVASMGNLKVIPHRERSEWILSPKYQIGKKGGPNTPGATL